MTRGRFNIVRYEPKAETKIWLQRHPGAHVDVQNVYANFEVSDALVAKMSA